MGRSSWAGAWPLERARGESDAGRWRCELGGVCTQGKQEVRWRLARGAVGGARWSQELGGCLAWREWVRGGCVHAGAWVGAGGAGCWSHAREGAGRAGAVLGERS
jgi:hypothetical protein